MAKDNPETNPITIKPKTASHVVEQFSWVPLPCCSPPGCLLPITPLALSALVSSDNSFLSIRQKPALGALEGGPPFLQHNCSQIFPSDDEGESFKTSANDSQMNCLVFLCSSLSVSRCLLPFFFFPFFPSLLCLPLSLSFFLSLSL